MRITNQISIPDRLKPGLPTTTTGTIGQQGASRNDGQRSSKSEREGLQDGSETSYVVWVGGAGTDEKTAGGGAGEAELKMLRFLLRVDNIKNEYIRGTAQVSWFGDKERGKTEMVWTCAKEGCRVYWEKDAGDGVPRQEENKKAKEEIHREDMQVVGTAKEGAEDKERWKQMILCGDP
ncbi:hypothetical protein LDENG_00047750 [Lucifuga dentata]|nr:hypothetical protein LDENG_00047750 [Lucifuga dentata]